MAADDPASDEPLLDSLSFEITLLAVKRYAALLPANHIPESWLRELATADCPALAGCPRSWEWMLRVLVLSGVLLRDNAPGTGLRVAGYAACNAVQSMDEDELAATRRRLRDFCSRRLEASRTEERRLINRVMTGDPDTEVTAWTVPRIELVRARAADDDRVEVVEFGDGTYSVRRKPDPASETESLKAFIAHEFAGHDLEGVAWALRTKLLTAAELGAAEDRLGNGHLHNPDSDDAAFVAALYWLNLAHKRYGEGWSSRGSWQLCGQAAVILKRLLERKPDDPEATALLAEVERAQWSYDD